MMTKILRYARALTRWIKNGREVRSNNDIRELYDNICSRCEDFDAGRGACGICGCRVNTSDNPLVNKLAMATEACPKEKWGIGEHQGEEKEVANSCPVCSENASKLEM